ncbi:hypothetical protein BKA80DRAFT_36857 [Phyllosticta citrichinensis]
MSRRREAARFPGLRHDWHWCWRAKRCAYRKREVESHVAKFIRVSSNVRGWRDGKRLIYDRQLGRHLQQPWSSLSLFPFQACPPLTRDARVVVCTVGRGAWPSSLEVPVRSRHAEAAHHSPSEAVLVLFSEFLTRQPDSLTSCVCRRVLDSLSSCLVSYPCHTFAPSWRRCQTSFGPAGHGGQSGQSVVRRNRIPGRDMRGKGGTHPNATDRDHAGGWMLRLRFVNAAACVPTAL